MKKKFIKIIFILLFIFLPKTIFAYDFNDANIDSETRTLLEDLSATWPSNIDNRRVNLIKKAATLMNKGITYGANDASSLMSDTPSHMDCSDFVSWAYYHSGITDVSLDWYTGNFIESSLFKEINESDLIPGDIGLNSNDMGEGNSNHVVIYIGRLNNENIYFHSSTNGPSVRHGNGYTTLFKQYTKWSDVKQNNDSSSSDDDGPTGGSTVDPAIGLNPLQTGDLNCETIFYNADGSKKEIKKILDNVFIIIEIAAPVIAIILSVLDYLKAIASGSNIEIKKVNTRTIKRIIFAVLIIFLPYLLDLIFNILGLYDISRCNIGS